MSNGLRVEKCPQCGAPARAAATKCEYCAAEFALRSLGELSAMRPDSVRKYADWCGSLLPGQPNNAELNFSLGLCHLKRRLFEMAYKCFLKAMEESPDNADCMYYCALSIAKGKRPELLTLPEVKRIEEYIKSAVAISDEKSIYYYFWTVIKRDFFEASGLRSAPPSSKELMDKARALPSDNNEIRELLCCLSLANDYFDGM